MNTRKNIYKRPTRHEVRGKTQKKKERRSREEEEKRTWPVLEIPLKSKDGVEGGLDGERIEGIKEGSGLIRAKLFDERGQGVDRRDR